MQALAVTTYDAMDLTFLAVGSFLFFRWKDRSGNSEMREAMSIVPSFCQCCRQRQQPTDLVQGPGVQQLRTRRTRPRTDLDS